NHLDRILTTRRQLESEFRLSQRESMRDHLADPHFALIDQSKRLLQISAGASVRGYNFDLIAPKIKERNRHANAGGRRRKKQQCGAAVEGLDRLLNGRHRPRTHDHQIRKPTLVELAQTRRYILRAMNDGVGAELLRRIEPILADVGCDDS